MSDSTAETSSALSLLTPTESNALWSFLSQADSADVLAPEWGIFANRPELAPRNREGKEDLARATRSLTTMDDQAGAQRYHVYPGHPPRAPGQSYKAPDLTVPRTNATSESSHNNSQQHPMQRQPSGGEVRYDAHGAPSSSSASYAQNPLIAGSDASAPVNQHSHPRKRLSQDQPQKTNGNKRARKSSPTPPDSNSYPTASAVGRRGVVQIQPLTIPPASADPPPKSNISPSSDAPYSAVSESPFRQQTHHGTTSTSASGGGGHKPPLLSTSQKKANHIQSEQKRRANIRRGYEALCEIVPALREAIRAEEEAERLALAELEAPGAGGPGANVNAGSSEDGNALPSNPNAGTAAALARKKARGKAVAAAFGVEEGEKVDGRAGPRSEAVVLQKTIDHLGALETQRLTLLDRLQHLRSVLPPSHPALIPSPIPPQLIASRRAPFIPPPPAASPEEQENWNEGSAAPEFDERVYEVPVWSRVWDGGTGLPIPGMGLPKPGMMGSGSGSGAGRGGRRGSTSKGTGGGGGGEGEYEDSDEDM